jgi:hypothetical protein
MLSLLFSYELSFLFENKHEYEVNMSKVRKPLYLAVYGIWFLLYNSHNGWARQTKTSEDILPRSLAAVAILRSCFAPPAPAPQRLCSKSTLLVSADRSQSTIGTSPSHHHSSNAPIFATQHLTRTLSNHQSRKAQ